MNELESLVEVLATACHDEGLAVIAVNRRGNVSYWSSGARDLFGYDPERMLNVPVTRLAPHAELLVDDLLVAAAQGEFPRPVELRVDREDGTPLSVRMRAVPAGAPSEGCILTARAGFGA